MQYSEVLEVLEELGLSERNMAVVNLIHELYAKDAFCVLNR